MAAKATSQSTPAAAGAVSEVLQEDTQPDEPDVDDLADVAEVPKGKRRIEQPKSNASKSSQNLTRDF